MDNIRKVLDDHKMWLAGLGGERANLSDADLSNTDLRGINLSHANLIGAHLSGADLSNTNLSNADLSNTNLSDTNLRGAHLSHANLIDANLSDADLSDAYLIGADLGGANLSGADLIGADLSGADLRGTIIDHTTIGVPMACPETGSFHAWKKCKDKVLVKLRIPEDAKRSSAATMKCRADKVEVLEVLGADVGVSERGQIYEIGEIVVADSWDGNRWNECSHGIHFFVNRSDAETWAV